MEDIFVDEVPYKIITLFKFLSVNYWQVDALTRNRGEQGVESVEILLNQVNQSEKGRL